MAVVEALEVMEALEAYHAGYWLAGGAEAAGLKAAGVKAAEKTGSKRRAQTKRRMQRRGAGVKKRAGKAQPDAKAAAVWQSAEDAKRAALMDDFVRAHPDFPGMSGCRAAPERLLTFAYWHGQASCVIPLVWPGPA